MTQCTSHVIKGAKPSYKLSRVVDLCISDLERCNNDIQFSLFVDFIDVRPENLEYLLYLKVVSSICTGSWILNATQLSRVPPSLKIVLILRPDIFEAVPFQNRGAKLDIHSHLIDWTTRYNRYRDSDLFKFTDHLLYVQQNNKDKLRQGDTWGHYFPVTVESRKFEQGDDPFILFLRHSFYKPRDIVKYLDLMQQAYATDNRGEMDRFTEDFFSDKDIRKKYSNYLLQEI